MLPVEIVQDLEDMFSDVCLCHQSILKVVARARQWVCAGYGNILLMRRAMRRKHPRKVIKRHELFLQLFGRVCHDPKKVEKPHHALGLST
jgi:hypothetical protein